MDQSLSNSTREVRSDDRRPVAPIMLENGEQDLIVERSVMEDDLSAAALVDETRSAVAGNCPVVECP
ncbi:hypothetical protein [Nakamurella sp. PAMC28650]|uniref:hypothetical protein n=1 Tax=Nakamurella sp. PAMC28650 TaxID=2762325 RepID=UPI00164E74CC|nr:hypothetical protein [Nakamurella sp. PAMC28650]QNK81498.1 hypothetical protein H7F38_01170 [Nakamurella sp. PAMC28650]